VPVTDAACQSSSHDEQASAAQQRLEEMQGEVTGLQLKVESLQGIVDIQEQQLQAAAGQTADQASKSLWPYCATTPCTTLQVALIPPAAACWH